MIVHRTELSWEEEATRRHTNLSMPCLTVLLIECDDVSVSINIHRLANIRILMPLYALYLSVWIWILSWRVSSRYFINTTLDPQLARTFLRGDLEHYLQGSFYTAILTLCIWFIFSVVGCKLAFTFREINEIIILEVNEKAYSYSFFRRLSKG